jgi:hypothetical protein
LIAATLAAGVAMLAVHAVYWPGIYRIWRPWLPKFIQSLIPVAKQGTGGALTTWNPQFGWLSRIYVFFEGVHWLFLIR